MNFKNVMIFVLNDKDKQHWKDSSNLRAVFWLSIQIENCLDLGWKKEDIIIGTNFKFEYKGIKSIILENSTCEYSPVMTKTLGIYELMNRGILTENFWVHDLDAWQNYTFEFPTECKDIGFTTSPSGLLEEPPRSINSGSYFVRPTAKDLVKYAIDVGNRTRCRNDEYAWNHINPAINSKFTDRVCFLNQTYNIGGGMRRYGLAQKPILVIHDRNLHSSQVKPRKEDGHVVISDRLLNLLKENNYVNQTNVLNLINENVIFERRDF